MLFDICKKIENLVPLLTTCHFFSISVSMSLCVNLLKYEYHQMLLSAQHKTVYTQWL